MQGLLRKVDPETSTENADITTPQSSEGCNTHHFLADHSTTTTGRLMVFCGAATVPGIYCCRRMEPRVHSP